MLLAYDFLLQFAFGLLSPIFAVFVLKALPGSSLKVIGTATACYWIARVLTTVPLSRFMDRTDGEKDEYYFLLTGSLVISIVPLLYLMMKMPWHLYLIQLLYGVANSMAVPGWRILFTDHLDKGSTGYEWSLDDIAVGVSIGASAYIGARLAETFGYGMVLGTLSLLSFSATALLFSLRHEPLSRAELNKEFAWRFIFGRRRASRSKQSVKIKYGAV